MTDEAQDTTTGMWSKPKLKHTAKHTFPPTWDPITSSNPYEYLSDSQEQEYQSAPDHRQNTNKLIIAKPKTQ